MVVENLSKVIDSKLSCQMICHLEFVRYQPAEATDAHAYQIAALAA
jgi:hypothetical protein